MLSYRALPFALISVLGLLLATPWTSGEPTREGILAAEPISAQQVIALLVPLTTEDWHGGWDLEIGKRGNVEDLQFDSLSDSLAEELQEKIAALDTREWHSQYDLSIGTKAWAEFGTPERLTDSFAVNRMLTGLAFLDSIGYPKDPDSLAVQGLRQSFPTLPDDFQPWHCGVFTRDLDGCLPRDVIAFLHSGGSAGCYALHVAVRSPEKVTFQVLDGCRRGMHNMFWRAGENESPFRANSGYNDSVLTVAATEKRFLLVHNNLWWPESSGVMTEMCDLIVPYFWDGEKLSWDEEAASVFYEKLSRSLHLLSPPDSEVIGTAIGTMF